MAPSILKALHDTSMSCTSAAQRSALQDQGNAIRSCMRVLEFGFSDEALRKLNGLWAHAHHLIKTASKPSDTPGGQSGAGEILQLEKLAA